MKKIILLIALGVVTCFGLSSCEKADSWKFDYSQDVLCGGTWNGTAIKSEGKWIDITSYLYSKFQFSIKFNTDGTYYGSGYFGNGSGTYKAYGKTIDTYVDGELFYTYQVISMTGDQAELSMSNKKGSSIDIRVIKK